MLLNKAGEFLERTFPKFGIFLRNGTLLNGTISLQAIEPLMSQIIQLFQEIDVGLMYIKPPVYFYHLTENIGLLVLTSLSENVVESMFELFTQKFKEDFEKEYRNLPPTLKDLVKFIIFSTTRQAGPEPVAWLSNTKELNEKEIFQYSLSSLMLLMNELEGAHKRVLNFHPFISENYLGLIYLFQIPLKKARGGAFDSSLLIMCDYSERALLYKLNYQLEGMCSQIADRLIEEFKEHFEEDINKPFNQEEREKFKQILNHLLDSFEKITLRSTPDSVIKEKMMDSIKELEEL